MSDSFLHIGTWRSVIHRGSNLHGARHFSGETLWNPYGKMGDNIPTTWLNLGPCSKNIVQERRSCGKPADGKQHFYLCFWTSRLCWFKTTILWHKVIFVAKGTSKHRNTVDIQNCRLDPFEYRIQMGAFCSRGGALSIRSKTSELFASTARWQWSSVWASSPAHITRSVNFMSCQGWKIWKGPRTWEDVIDFGEWKWASRNTRVGKLTSFACEYGHRKS